MNSFDVLNAFIFPPKYHTTNSILNQTHYFIPNYPKKNIRNIYTKTVFYQNTPYSINHLTQSLNSSLKRLFKFFYYKKYYKNAEKTI